MDWSRSEVSGVAEGTMHTSASPQARKEDTRVTSIRSSLFKKAAEKDASPPAGGGPPGSAGGSPGCGSGPGGAVPSELVFKNEAEIADLDRTLTHLTNSSMDMCEYGKGSNKSVWARDIFALLHNGIRCELRDLSTCLRALKSIRENLTLHDYKELRSWWTTFSSVITDYVGLEDRVLIPWVEAALAQATSPDTRASSFVAAASGRRHTLRGAILAIGRMFSTMCDPLPAPLRAKAPPQSKTATSIVMHMDRVISLIADYMWEEEMQLTGLLSAQYDERRDRDEILAAIVRHMTSELASKSSEFLVLQTRWMTDPKMAKAHTKALLAIHDCQYAKLQSQFEMNHAAIVAVLKVKADI
jgi:hypothetical protein